MMASKLVARAPIKVVSGSASRSFVASCGQPALTLARVISCYAATSGKTFTLLAVKPVTGRTHQIRVHLASLGRPLAADAAYNPHNLDCDIAWCPRLFLHCSRVVLHELDGSHLSVKASFPQDLASALTHLSRIDYHSNIG